MPLNGFDNIPGLSLEFYLKQDVNVSKASAMRALVFFLLFLTAGIAQAKTSSSLTLYVYPPYRPLNWESPQTVLHDFLGIEIGRQLTMDDAVKFQSGSGDRGTLSSTYKSTMGHTLSHVQCRLSNGELFDRWTSFSGQNYVEIDKKNLLKEQLGLGVLFYNYPDGHIVEGEENIKRITHYAGNSPRYLEVEIDAVACDGLKEMITFFEGFHFKSGTPLKELLKRPATQTLYFNSTLDPYDAYLNRLSDPSAIVGGGCAPYGAALLKMARRYSDEFDESWKLRVAISEKLIGGPTRRVSISALLFGSLGTQWQYAGYSNRVMTVFDPAKIWNFLGEARDCLKNRIGCSSSGANWAGRQQVAQGPTQLFTDQILKTVTFHHPKLGLQSKKVQVKVKQPVDGLIWRLR